MADQSVNRRLLFLLAMPAVLQGFMHAPAASLVQGVYAKHVGLPLAALGTAVMITRLFDALVDPWIGIMSDAWCRRGGSRRSWIVVGTVTMVVALWFLYRPGPDADLAYFTGWFILAYLGWTINEIPYRAWSLDLSSDYQTRQRIQTWLGIGVAVGTFMFFALPMIAKRLGLLRTTEVDLDAMALAAVFIVLLAPLTNLLAIWRVPEVHPPLVERVPPDSRELWRAVIGNGPLIYFTLMFLLVGITGGMSQGVAYLFVDGYLGHKEEMAGILLLGAPATLLGMPLWGAVCQRYERQKVWAVCMGVTAACYLGTGLLPSGEAGVVPYAVVFTTLMFFLACTWVAVGPMVGDIVDYGRWKFGHDHAGLYLAAFSIVNKSVAGLGVALGFIVLDWLGYDATAQVQSPQGIAAMKAVAIWIPAVAVALLAPFIWKFPINRARHAQIVRDLEAREREARWQTSQPGPEVAVAGVAKS